MKLPPFASLRAFEAVARHRSVRRAAEELGLDHTVVSRHLKTLQAFVDVPRLQTSRQGVTLPPGGADYQEKRSTSLTVWCMPGFALR
ncbi:LysR family transcriptional regulator [Azospirillum sp. RWY-5-1]|uniref:LysR family transcriptional regulator n=1 Tax=Azospirillum oleiclasticum TaxID=2735135 RepID=A0ABX2TKX0_9PROT|nr:LysR family transcriptional regulator [Azospirillum oleiclasticum]NYZ14363.1 LysR family transcriptional regulator [Azospirillum oleiclasticum]NYZ23285.1 LysR family transcriptional regulator [Azospirillum oleiclasticum]